MLLILMRAGTTRSGASGLFIIKVLELTVILVLTIADEEGRYDVQGFSDPA
jgi:hypothetical protein